MKQFDEKYNKIRIFEDVFNIDGSEKLKEQFITLHQQNLEIDEMIDNIMDSE